LESFFAHRDNIKRKAHYEWADYFLSDMNPELT